LRFAGPSALVFWSQGAFSFIFWR